MVSLNDTKNILTKRNVRGNLEHSSKDALLSVPRAEALPVVMLQEGSSNCIVVRINIRLKSSRCDNGITAKLSSGREKEATLLSHI